MTADTPESASPPSPTSDFSQYDNEQQGWRLTESKAPPEDGVRTGAVWQEVQRTRFRKVFLYLPTGRYWLFFLSTHWTPPKHFGVDLGTCSRDDQIARKEATKAVAHYRSAFHRDVLRARFGVLPNFRNQSTVTWGQAWVAYLKIRDSGGDVSEATKTRESKYWQTIHSFYTDDLSEMRAVEFRRHEWLIWWQAVNGRYSRTTACNLSLLWKKVADASQEIDARLRLWSWPPAGMLGQMRLRRPPTKYTNKFLSREEVERVIEFTRRQTSDGLLDALYFRVMADAGARSEDLKHMIWGDVRLSEERPKLAVGDRLVPLLEVDSEQLLEDFQMAWAILLPKGYDPVFKRPPTDGLLALIKKETGVGSLVQRLPRFFVKSRLEEGYRIDRVALWTGRHPLSIVRDYLPEMSKVC